MTGAAVGPLTPFFSPRFCKRTVVSDISRLGVAKRRGTATFYRVKALRRFTVRPQLPEPLQPLGALIRNLRWSWHPSSQDLFADIDRGLWRRFEGDPLKLLGAVSVSRLAELAEDQDFLDRMHGL